MFIFNLLFGIVLLAMILLIPQVKKYLKKKYDFKFSPMNLTNKQTIPTQSLEVAELSEPTQVEEMQEKNKLESSNSEFPISEQSQLSTAPAEQPSPLEPDDSLSYPKSDTQNNKKTAKETSLDTATSSQSHLSNSEKNEANETTTINQQVAEASTPIENPEPPTEKKVPKSSEKKIQTPISRLTFYILPKKHPGEVADLHGSQIIDALLNQKNEGEIRFNAKDNCFTHYHYTKTDKAIYHIYQATDPVLFPDSEQEVNEIITTGLMFDIQFPVDIPAVYAYNTYFRKTALQVAEILDYKVYDEQLKEWTNKRLEETRRALLTQTQGSLL